MKEVFDEFLINEMLYSKNIDVYKNRNLRHVPMKNTVGIASNILPDSKKEFIVYLNDEVGGIKLVTRTSHFEKAVREARISYEKLNGYSSEKKAIMVY